MIIVLISPTSPISFKKGGCLIGVKRAFVQKEVISTNKEAVYMVVNFSFTKRVYFLT